MIVRERDIQARVVGYARAKQCLARKLDFGQGWPDYMILHHGELLFIEFKQASGRLTPLQEHIHAELRKRGFEVHVVRDIEHGILLIEKFVAQPAHAVVDYGSITRSLCK